DLRPQNRLCIADRLGRQHVQAVAVIALVRSHRQHDVEISCAPAAPPVLSLAGQPQPGAVVDTCRDPHLALPPLLDSPGAAALRTRIGDHLSLTMTLRTGPGDDEHPLREAHLSAPRAGPAGLRLTARR